MDHDDPRMMRILAGLKMASMDTFRFEARNREEILRETPRFLKLLPSSCCLITGMSVPNMLPWLLLAKLWGVKVVIDCPVDITAHPFIGKTWWRYFIQFLLRSADLVVILKSRDYLIEKFNLKSQRVVFFENCAYLKPIESSESFPPGWSFPEKSYRLCFSGVAGWHGIDQFFEIFLALTQKVPHVHLLMLSQLSLPMIQNFKKRVEENGLEAAVTFHPVIKPYEAFISTLSQCDLWLSHFDNQSLLGQTELRTELFELAALSKPVVCIETPAMKQHGFKDGENILYVNPGEPETSAENIATLLMDRDRREKMGKSLHDFAKIHFDLQKQILPMAKILQDWGVSSGK